MKTQIIASIISSVFLVLSFFFLMKRGLQKKQHTSRINEQQMNYQLPITSDEQQMHDQHTITINEQQMNDQLPITSDEQQMNDQLPIIINEQQLDDQHTITSNEHTITSNEQRIAEMQQRIRENQDAIKAREKQLAQKKEQSERISKIEQIKKRAAELGNKINQNHDNIQKMTDKMTQNLQTINDIQDNLTQRLYQPGSEMNAFIRTEVGLSPEATPPVIEKHQKTPEEAAEEAISQFHEISNQFQQQPIELNEDLREDIRKSKLTPHELGIEKIEDYLDELPTSSSSDSSGTVRRNMQKEMNRIQRRYQKEQAELEKEVPKEKPKRRALFKNEPARRRPGDAALARMTTSNAINSLGYRHYSTPVSNFLAGQKHICAVCKKATTHAHCTRCQKTFCFKDWVKHRRSGCKYQLS